MKLSSHKNQFVVTALAVMIVVAGYLNFTGQEISTGGIGKIHNAETTGGKQSNVSKEDKSDISDEELADISAEDIGSDEYVVEDTGEVVASEENPGEAVMVSNTLGSDYFASAKLSREQTRAKNKETLMDIVNNDKIASADKKAAVKEVAAITRNSERESAAELMLEAKGFENAMVSISNGNADVIVDSKNLTDKEIAQIEDIVKRKTGIESANIVITPVDVTK